MTKPYQYLAKLIFKDEPKILESFDMEAVEDEWELSDMEETS